MDSVEIQVDTSRQRVVDLTPAVERFCAGRGDGLVNVLAPHATAGLALMETRSGRRTISSTLWDGSSPGTTATVTRMDRPVTGPIICFPHSSARR